MFKRIIVSLSIVFLIAALAFAVISYSMGYRFDPKQKSLTSTGILSASSFPEKASIFVNNKLMSATSASLSLTPGWYDIRIGKEGYQSWQKKIHIQGEVVSQVDALLIPNSPSLRALTVNGALNPSLAPSGSRVAYIVVDDSTPSATIKSKTGIWVQSLRTGTLGGKEEPIQIFQPLQKYDWTTASLTWSPDERTIAVVFTRKLNKRDTIAQVIQVGTDNLATTGVDITTVYLDLLSEWSADRFDKQTASLASLPEPIGSILTNSADHIHFSPDDSKVLYMATGAATLTTIITPPLIGSNTTPEERKLVPGKYYIYDQKEDKNFSINDNKTITNVNTLIWYTDSKHIVSVEKDAIYISDYDGANKRAVYAGPFDPNVIYAWPAGQRLVIMANFNKREATPNLYLIDLT